MSANIEARPMRFLIFRMAQPSESTASNILLLAGMLWKRGALVKSAA